ncbi:sodium/glutamate symporter [Arenibacterium sp. CAU 1754]
MNLASQSTLLVPDFVTLTIGMIVFLFGAVLTRRVAFLRNLNIPEPVSGGLAVAVLAWAIFAATGLEIAFELDTRDELLVIFFVTIGLDARISDLISGGRLLLLLLLATLGFMVIQNLTGLAGAELFDLPRPIAVLLGSASLIGGHGTALAWGPTLQEVTGFSAANEIGIAAATLGLVFAALIGGPIGRYLIDRHKLEAEPGQADIVGLPYEETRDTQEVNHVNLIRALLAINIAIVLGYIVHRALVSSGLMLPLFVPCLMVAIVMSNTVPQLLPRINWPARTKALAVISDYSLSIFLSMSLMSIKLWTLSGLGGPLLAVLGVQALLTALFTVFLFFRFAGADYTAAVLSAGFAGFTLGSTPTAVANMSAVTKKYGPAPLAFIVLPLVAAFFVDLANSLVITLFSTF